MPCPAGLADVVMQVKTGMAQSAEGSKLTPEYMQRLDQVMTDGNKLLAAASPARQILLSQTVKASRLAEAMAALQISSTVTVMQGLANVLPNAGTSSAAQLRKVFEAQREHRVASNAGQRHAQGFWYYRPVMYMAAIVLIARY